MLHSLTDQRARVTSQHLAILDFVWSHYSTNLANEWPLVRSTNIRFTRPALCAALRALPRGSIFIADGIEPRYQLTLSGLLLASTGPHAEKLLVRYFKYVHEQATRRPDLAHVRSRDVSLALGLHTTDVALLGQSLLIGHFWSGNSSLGGEGWICGVPPDLDRFPEIGDFIAYIHQAALDISARVAESTEFRATLEAAGMGISSPTAPSLKGPSAASLPSSPPAAEPVMPAHATPIEIDGINLMASQVELLRFLVEAASTQRADGRQPFHARRLYTGPTDTLNLLHSEIPKDHPGINGGDLQELIAAELLRSRGGDTHTIEFQITPRGFTHNDKCQAHLGKAAQRVERSTRSYVDDSGFRERHPAAFDKWQDADRLLDSSDSTSVASTIGHLCREAHQEFATSLSQYSAAPASTDKTHTKVRIRAALESLSLDSEKVSAVATALAEYWCSVIDLAQRQEHGAIKDGRPLVAEDARRLVFQTIFVMVELDRICRQARLEKRTAPVLPI